MISGHPTKLSVYYTTPTEAGDSTVNLRQAWSHPCCKCVSTKSIIFLKEILIVYLIYHISEFAFLNFIVYKKCNCIEDMIFVILVFLLNFINNIQGYDDSVYFAEDFDKHQNCKNKTAIEILEKKGRCRKGKKGSLDNCKIRLSKVLRDKCSATKVLYVSKYLEVNFGQSLWCESLL